MDEYDVVVVGGGIAGSALASVLAPAGVRVLVLERQTAYRDKVRGEFMLPWGVAEAIKLDLGETLLAAGGVYSPLIASYGEGIDPVQARADALPLAGLIPGVDGALCVGHPQASEALNSRASEQGAVVVRGVGDVEITAGVQPSVRYEYNGDIIDVRCRLVVGADGRQSTVRRGLGFGLEQVESKATLGGLLVRCDWTDDASFIGSEGDSYYLGFPRAGGEDGVVRVYLACTPSSSTSGADRTHHMLESFRLSSLPDSDRIADGEPAGPCSFYIGSDSWTERPVSDGVALIGDAAGWSDPIIGQGLSVAMRDARSVADVLLGGDDWSPEAFEPYVVERAERMRRLKICAHVTTVNRCTFTDAGRAQREAYAAQMMTDPLVLGLVLATAVGPENTPEEAFTDENIERVLSLT